MQAHLLNVDTVLLTPRTVIRRFRENDGAPLFELVQNNYAQLSDHFPYLLERLRSGDDTEFFVRDKIARWLLQKEYAFGIWQSEEARLIGLVSLLHIDWQVPEGRLTFFIGQGHGNQGIMTEVLLHLQTFLFRQLRMERVYVKMAQDNFSAQRLARKCGFRREGDLRNAFRRPSGELLDMMLMALTRAEFEKA